jgi:hypothetical protein
MYNFRDVTIKMHNFGEFSVNLLEQKKLCAGWNRFKQVEKLFVRRFLLAFSVNTFENNWNKTENAFSPLPAKMREN